MGKLFVKTVSCKSCNTEFVIEYDNTQSGFSKCHKRYCSDACKKTLKKAKTSNARIEHACQECEKIYYLPKSLSKQSHFCSRLCQNRSQAKKNAIERIAILCKNCSSSFNVVKTSKRKYCSLTCSRQSSKTSTREICACQMCGLNFEKYKTNTARFCGRSCQYAAQSSGLIKINTHGRPGKRSDLHNQYFRSALEADYARYCQHAGISYLFESKTFVVNAGSGSVKYYTPDFYHPAQDCYVETKAGRQDGAYENNLKSVKVLQQQGIAITVVFMNEFYEMLKAKGLYDVIPNLERRNYKRTKHLVT